MNKYHTIWYELHGRYYQAIADNNPSAIQAKKADLRAAGAIILP